MKRRVLNALAGLSLILALATGGLWISSHSRTDRLYWQGAKGFAWTQSERGDLVIQLEHARVCADRSPAIGYEDGNDPNNPRSFYDLRYVSYPIPPNIITFREFAGFWCCDMSDPSGSSIIAIAFPHWSLLLALAILPTLRGWQLLRARRRRSENLCPQCGYDLRATPNRCPECGMKPRSDWLSESA